MLFIREGALHNSIVRFVRFTQIVFACFYSASALVAFTFLDSLKPPSAKGENQVKHRPTFDVVILGYLIVVHLLTSKDQPALEMLGGEIRQL